MSNVAGASSTLTTRHWPALDGLRAVAVLVVLTLHSWGTLLPGGAVGVDVFFALSGFLITTLLLQEREQTGRVSYAGFYRRRALRLFPALALVLIVVTVYMLTLRPEAVRAHTLGALPWVIFYIANWGPALGLDFGLLQHAWSLAIEEQFYVFWPVILMMLLRFGRRAALIGCIVGIIASAVLQQWLVNVSSSARVFYGTDTRAEPLLVGCAVAVAASLGWFDRLPDRAANMAFALGVTVLVVIAARASSWDLLFRHWGMTLIAVSCGALIVRAAAARATWLERILGHPWPMAIGRISYGVYLWNMPIAGILPLDDGPAKLMAVTVLTLVVAGMSYRFVELPFLKMKERTRVVPARAEQES